MYESKIKRSNTLEQNKRGVIINIISQKYNYKTYKY